MSRLLIVALLFLAACAGDDVAQRDDGTLVLGTGKVSSEETRGVNPAGRALVIDLFAGSVDLSATDAESADLTFERHARADDEEEARERMDGIRIVETGVEGAYRYTVTSDDADRTEVDITGTIPAATPLTLNLPSGTVRLDGLSSNVTIRVSNGTVVLTEMRGGADVELNNGNVDAAFSGLGGDVQIETRNGNLALTLPANASADIDARTSAGSISADGLPLRNRDLDPSGAGASFSAQLSDAARRVRLRTENGTIALRGN